MVKKYVLLGQNNRSHEEQKDSKIFKHWNPWRAKEFKLSLIRLKLYINNQKKYINAK